MADETRLERWMRTIVGKIIVAVLAVGAVMYVVDSFADSRKDAEVEFTRDSLIAVQDSIKARSALKDSSIVFLEERNDTLEKAKKITNKTLDSLKIVTKNLQKETEGARTELAHARTSEDSLRAALLLVIRQDEEIIACGLTVESCMQNGVRLQEMVNNATERGDILQEDRDIWKTQAEDNLVALDEAIAKLQCTVVFGIKCPSRNAAAIGGLVLGLVGGYFIFSSSDEPTIIVQQPPPEYPPEQ